MSEQRKCGSQVCDENTREILYDARGIECGYACNKCRKEKMSRYRADVFSNPDYECDEPIDED
jgi:hypothetical protein